jgi:ethanolamine utilization microcompartment shell protein EutL
VGNKILGGDNGSLQDVLTGKAGSWSVNGDTYIPGEVLNALGGPNPSERNGDLEFYIRVEPDDIKSGT